MDNKEEMLELIEEENMKGNNSNCIGDECEDCPDIEYCYAEAVSKCSSEFAENVNYGGYDSEEEFWENI